jgi:hypothetical protein
MPKTITQLPAAASAETAAVVAADNAAGTATEKVTLGGIVDLARTNTVTSPAEITAHTNDYEPGAGGDIFRVTADGAYNLTGVVARASGDTVLLVNIGATHDITIKHASADSTDVNRILVPREGDYVLSAKGGSALLAYDDTTERWRVIGGLGGTLVTPPAAEPFATLVSTKSTGNVSGSARSTTGYIKVEWWDATSNVYGTGVAGGNIEWSKAAGGAGSKTVLIYPSDASGNLDGSLTILNCGENSLTSLDVSGLTSLAFLNCAYNSLTSLDVSGLITALTGLYCHYNSLTSLDVSGLTALTQLDCSNNSLTSLRAQGVGFSGGYYYSSLHASYAATIAENQLQAAALNQFYTDLDPGDSPLLVFYNPGTFSDDPSIATNKGYTVYGS